MASAELPHVPVIPPTRFFFGVSLAAAVFFALWTWLALDGRALPDFDRDCAEYWHDWSALHPGALAFMIFLTDLGGVAAMTLLAVMGSIWQTAIKHKTLVI